jgi:hypothetical protein
MIAAPASVWSFVMGNRAACPFTETDIRRLIHAVESAGKVAHGVCFDLRIGRSV